MPEKLCKELCFAAQTYLKEPQAGGLISFSPNRIQAIIPVLCYCLQKSFIKARFKKETDLLLCKNTNFTAFLPTALFVSGRSNL